MVRLLHSPGLSRGGLYYGWYIVALAFIAQAMSAGLQVYTFGVFLKPMSEDLGLTRAELAGVQSFSTLVSGVLALAIGPLIDRRGGRELMVGGALIAGAGLAGVGLVHNLWQFYLIRGVVVTVGMLGMGGLVVNVALSNWFVRRRGRAIAVAAMGISVAAVVLPPLTQWLITRVGWRGAWGVLGLLVILVVTMPAALIMRRRPEDLGLQPDGDAATRTATGPPAPDADEYAWSRAAALRTPTLWLLMLAFALASMGLMGMLVHTYPYLTDRGLSAAEAARGLSLIGIAGLLCKPCWGLLVERFAARRCAAAEFLLCAAGIGLIRFAQDTTLTYAAIFLFGLGVGGVMTVQEVIWAEYFGRLTLGRIRSVAMPFTIASSAGGPVFAAWVFDATGSYRGAFLLFILTYLVAAALISLARRPERPWLSVTSGTHAAAGELVVAGTAADVAVDGGKEPALA